MKKQLYKKTGKRLLFGTLMLALFAGQAAPALAEEESTATSLSTQAESSSVAAEQTETGNSTEGTGTGNGNLAETTETVTPTPTETPAEETPAVTPTETPAVTPTETPAAEPTPSATPTETPAVTPEQTPTETPAVTPTETPAATPAAEETAASSADETAEKAGEKEENKEEEKEKKTVLLQVVIEGKGEVLLTVVREDGSEENVILSGDKFEPIPVLAGSVLRVGEKSAQDYLFVEWKTDKENCKVEEGKLTVPAEGLTLTAVFKDKKEVEERSSGGASQEAQDENANKPKKTNEELIAEQNIVPLPVTPRDFRFWTVEKEVEFIKEKGTIQEDIREDARAVAKVNANDAVFVLEEVDQDWYYVESGEARGFIKKEYVVDPEEKKERIKEYARIAQREVAAQKSGQPISAFFSFAEVVVDAKENEAYLYRKCTTAPVVIKKNYALAKKDGVEILEETKEEARVCGVLSKNALCYVIKEEGKWIYVESGDVRGFVKKEQIRSGAAVEKEVKEKGEEKYSSCTAQLSPEENEATYYTLTSVKEGVPLHPVRDAIIKSAEQCLGHPYVWGGTSLLGGCDCSGFVQSLYAMYGYHLPRVAEDQARFGRQIPVENAQPGDLIFFAQNGYVHHVALYVGNDQTIEAYGTAVGIIRNGVDHAGAVWATRVIED